MRATCRLAASAAFLFLFVGQMLGELPPLIPREILFGNPERANPQISPDGKYLAYLAPDKKNVLQVWMRTVGQQADKMLTADKKRGIRIYFWTYDGEQLIYLQDADGDENWHFYAVNIEANLSIGIDQNLVIACSLDKHLDQVLIQERQPMGENRFVVGKIRKETGAHRHPLDFPQESTDGEQVCGEPAVLWPKYESRLYPRVRLDNRALELMSEVLIGPALPA